LARERKPSISKVIGGGNYSEISCEKFKGGVPKVGIHSYGMCFLHRRQKRKDAISLHTHRDAVLAAMSVLERKRPP